jgi:predicted nucleotidyltransferase
LDPREVDFFKLLDKNIIIIEENAKIETNIIHGFDSYRSTIVPWLRRTDIKEYIRDLKKNKIYISFIILKTTKSESELFLILEIIDEIFIEVYS